MVVVKMLVFVHKQIPQHRVEASGDREYSPEFMA